MKTLLVEPDRDKGQVLSAAIRQRGHEVEVPIKTATACTFLRRGSHAMVFLGIESLGEEAVDLCRRLRAVAGDRPCVILAVTANHDADHLQTLFAAGADDCLAEPGNDPLWDLRLTVAEARATGSSAAAERPTGVHCCPLVSDAPYGVFRTSAQGKFLQANPALVGILGYDSEEELLALDIARDVYRDPGRREALIASGEDCFTGFEVNVRRKDGTPISVRLSGRNVRSETGAVVELEGIIEDITKQKQAEEALRQTNEQLQAIYGGMVEGILVADVQTKKFLRTNPAMSQMLGYSEDELLSMEVAEVHPPEALPEALRQFEGMRQDQMHRIRQLPFLRKDGNTLLADVVASPIAYQGRKCLIGFFRDVTEHVRAVDAMAKSEARFRALFEGAPLGIALTDLEGKVMEVNPQLSHMLGYATEEFVGRSIVEMTHPDDLLGESHDLQRLKEGLCETVEREKRYHHKDGSTVWGHLSASVIRNTKGEPQFLIGVVKDITQRKRAEQALQESQSKLRESETRYRLIAENATDMIWTARLEGLGSLEEQLEGKVSLELADELLRRWQFTFLSPSVQRFLGYSVAEGMALGLTELLTPQSFRMAAQLLAEEVTREQQKSGELYRQRIVELEHHTKQGDLRWGEVTTTFLRDENHRITALLGVTRDITERKQAEEVIHQEQELLRQLLELHERDRELLAFELHDGFAQLLTGAMLNFEAAAQLGEVDPEKAESSFQQGTRLLSESISESRRLVSGLRPPVLDEFGIVPAIEHLVGESQASGGQKTRFVSKGRFQRLARPLESAIFRIVQETLTNARRHSQSDQVLVELCREQDHVRVTTQDWGVGFQPDQVSENCFGLKGIRERARLLGGKASIETALGEGTRVSIRFPLVQEAQDKADRAGGQNAVGSQPGS